MILVLAPLIETRRLALFIFLKEGIPMKKLPIFQVFWGVQEGIKNMCSIKNILRKSSTVLYSDDATQQYMEPWLLKSLLSKSNLHLDHVNLHTSVLCRPFLHMNVPCLKCTWVVVQIQAEKQFLGLINNSDYSAPAYQDLLWWRGL